MTCLKIAREDLIGTFEQKRKIVEQFNLMDDTFFAVVLEDKEACEYLLTALMKKPIKLIENKTQYSIRNVENHSIVLDALAEDIDHNLFDVEIQVDDKNNHERRLRYYRTAIDWSYLEKGVDYKKMPELYMIFISDFDPFERNRNNYEIVQYVKDCDLPYDDGVHRLYFNTAVRDDTELSKLLQYLANSDAANKSFGALSKAVAYHKNSSEGVGVMCKMVEEYAKGQAEKAEIKGKIEGKIEAVENMMSNGLELDYALKLIKLDKETYSKYKKLEQ